MLYCLAAAFPSMSVGASEAARIMPAAEQAKVHWSLDVGLSTWTEDNYESNQPPICLNLMSAT